MSLKSGLLALIVAIGATLHAQPSSLQDVLARAGEYHTAYTRKISGVSLEEQTQLMNVTGDITRSIVRISADVVLVNVSGQAEALRDVYAVDTRPTRERTPRILQLLAAPATPSVKDWQTAISYPGQEVVYFLLDIVVKTNEPTAALQFISAANQPALKFKLDGRKTMNNVAVVGVRFEEPEIRERKHLLGTRSNGRATGRLWIDPLTGAIHQTELWVDSRRERTYTESATVSVKYALHPTLDVLLPSESTGTFEEFDASGMRQIQTGANSGVAVDGRVSLQSRSAYSNATFAAINLSGFGGRLP
jgi:hypothetical protein